jgi:hypothetical protein
VGGEERNPNPRDMAINPKTMPLPPEESYHQITQKHQNNPKPMTLTTTEYKHIQLNGNVPIIAGTTLKAAELTTSVNQGL